MNDKMIDEMIKHGHIRDLVALPEPVFNIVMERVRRAHLEGKGYVFQDPHNPATCESCEG